MGLGEWEICPTTAVYRGDEAATISQGPSRARAALRIRLLHMLVRGAGGGKAHPRLLKPSLVLPLGNPTCGQANTSLDTEGVPWALPLPLTASTPGYKHTSRPAGMRQQNSRTVVRHAIAEELGTAGLVTRVHGTYLQPTRTIERGQMAPPIDPL